MQNSISIASFAFGEERERMKNLFRLFMKDELISWHNISKGFIDPKYLSNDKLLLEKIDTNVQLFLKKIDFLSPEFKKIEDINELIPLDNNVIEIIKQSLSDEYISKVECTSFPWF
jgi:hypothetical protein